MAPENEERKVDRALAEELETGYVSASAVLEALEGFGVKRAEGILNWAHGTGEPEKALLAWGRKRGASHARERRGEAAARSGKRLALEEPLRSTFRRQVAAEHLVKRRKAALEKGPGAHEKEVEAGLAKGDSMWDGERIAYGRLKLEAACAEEYPPETFEARLGFDPEGERELERRVCAGEELSSDDRRRVEVYGLAAEALAAELRGQVEFLEGRLHEALPDTSHSSIAPSKANTIREIKGLPYVPREYDR